MLDNNVYIVNAYKSLGISKDIPSILVYSYEDAFNKISELIKEHCQEPFRTTERLIKDCQEPLFLRVIDRDGYYFKFEAVPAYQGDPVIGYKAFNEDLTCREFRYEVGKEYEIEELPLICNRGFHFCKNPLDCFDYYELADTRICKVEASGIITERYNKMCTNKIKILEEFSDEELKLVKEEYRRYISSHILNTQIVDSTLVRKEDK